MTGRADRSHPDRLRWRKCQKENPSLSTPSSDSMPLWSATGRSRSPSCPFWSFLGVITKGYVQRVSPAKRALVSKQKKQPLLCNTLMLLLLSLTVIAQEKTRGGGGGSDARWKWLGQRVEGKGEEKREEVVLDDSLLPTSCTVTISVLCVLSSCSPFTVTQRPHSLQQHDITDYSHHLIKPHWWKWCSCFSDSYTYACSCSPAPLWLGFMCLMCRCYF